MAVLGFYKNPYYVSGVADFSQPSFWLAAAAIVFNPLYWNTVAQNEYRRKTITKLLGNRPYCGCYTLGLSIFLLGILRDHLYNNALSHQPVNAFLANSLVKYLGAALFIAGQVLVLSSMYALGVTGTYLGDYFGILMDSVVTGFPFNVIGDPMYWGSSLCFVGVALWFGKPAGLILSALVVVVYAIALRYESPFTASIYAAAAKKKGGSKTGAVSRRSSTAGSSSAKRTASTSRRSSTAASKKAAANGDASASTTPAKKRQSGSSTSARQRKNSSASVKAAASDAEGATGTPAKRGRKKKVAA